MVTATTVSRPFLTLATLYAFAGGTTAGTDTRQTRSLDTRAIVPLVQFIRSDSAIALGAISPDSILVEVSELVPPDRESVLDSLQQIAGVPLGNQESRSCAEVHERASLIARARCALAGYSHYVEFRDAIAHDSTAEVSVFLVQRAKGPARHQGVRKALTDVFARVQGGGSVMRGPISLHHYVAHLVLLSTGEWTVRNVVVPERAKRSVPADSGRGAGGAVPVAAATVPG